MAPADDDCDFEITSRWQEILEWWGLADCAHVFAKEDGQTDRWEEAALIPPGSNLKGKENAVFLCKSCHCQFDNTSNPGIVFFPADLTFFIEWEKSDQALRKEAAKNGAPVRRHPPTAADYKAYQVGQAEVDPTSIGGLYRTAIFEPFFASDLPTPVRRGVLEQRSQLKPWHGEPIFTIRRAFIILGTLQVKLLDPEVKRQLRELQDLYTSDEIEAGDNEFGDDSLLRFINRLNRGSSKRPHPGPDTQPPENRGGSQHPPMSPKAGNCCFGESPSKRIKHGCRSVDETAFACRHQLLLTPHRTLARRWQLGPNMTTEDAINLHSNYTAPA
ncbi:hypothetical protein N7454_006182 [Penicillium verhagenii]|nr:hypothetical protein N7454_006182 [Penicillium verhagenii]